MKNQQQNNLENVNKMFAAAIAFAIIATGCSAEANSSEINSLPEKTTTYAEVSTENTSETISSTEEISSTETETVATATETENLTEENAEKISPLVNFPEDVPFSAELSNLFTERDLRTEYEITESVDLNQVKDSVLEITQEGVYELSGQFSGQIHICCDGGKIQLVLNNAEISCSTGPAIYVEQAKKVFLTLAEHSENVLSDGTGYANETISGAAIFSADDLTINGTGSLQVTGNEDEGIVSKDKLTITGGKITVNAKGNGIRGKDDIAVYDGEMEVISGGDGLKSNNATDAGKGFIYIQNGKFTIDAQEDGIQAETELIISGGELNITSGGGTANAPEKQNSQNSMIPERFTPQNTSNADSENSENQISTKGMKAGTMAYFSGGTINMNASDDALHSNGKIYLSGSELEISSGDKAVHADTEVLISSGIVNIAQSYEGIESGNITISGGTVNITSSDDGFNASDGSEQGAMGAVSDCALTISGGEVSVNSGGDGLDSNGTLNITGGKIFVNGSENGGNGALDANNGITCSGGFLFASGMADMAEYPENPEQNVLVMTFDDYQAAGTLLILCDETGTEIFNYAPEKSFNSVVFSSDTLETGKTYTLFVNQAEFKTVTIENSVSFIGEPKSFGGGMMPGGRMDGGNIPPDGNGEMQPPAEKPFDRGNRPQMQDFPDSPNV